MLWRKIKPQGLGVREWDIAVLHRRQVDFLREKVAFEQRLEGDEEEAVGISEVAPRWRLPIHVCAATGSPAELGLAKEAESQEMGQRSNRSRPGQGRPRRHCEVFGFDSG